MSQVNAPFTEQQVKNINEYQKGDIFHPFTCMGHEGCRRSEKHDYGTLKATCEGLICPCGKYSQDWVHTEMAEFDRSKHKSFSEKLQILYFKEHFNKG